MNYSVLHYINTEFHTNSEFLRKYQLIVLTILFKVGVRKTLLENIADLHKTPWQPGSLPGVTLRDKQRGIYLNCPDCVSMVFNIEKHATLLRATARCCRISAANKRDRFLALIRK